MKSARSRVVNEKAVLIDMAIVERLTEGKRVERSVPMEERDDHETFGYCPPNSTYIKHMDCKEISQI
jgi:hypothetical protein